MLEVRKNFSKLHCHKTFTVGPYRRASRSMSSCSRSLYSKTIVVLAQLIIIDHQNPFNSFNFGHMINLSMSRRTHNCSLGLSQCHTWVSLKQFACRMHVRDCLSCKPTCTAYHSQGWPKTSNFCIKIKIRVVEMKEKGNPTNLTLAD